MQEVKVLAKFESNKLYIYFGRYIIVAKKSFLEKLGLVEPVESDGLDSPVEVTNYEEPSEKVGSTFDLHHDFKEDVVDEKSNQNELNQSEIFEKLKELSQVEAENVVEAENDNYQIEDKLNVLIGAYEKNKLLSIDEIYRSARLSSDMKKTIFIVDVFLKALPENLPVDIKRESVSNILNVSSIKIEDLLTDAYQRMDALNTVLEDTVQTTDDVVERNYASIKELESRIEDIKRVVEQRRKFQEDQNTTIEYEVQKIINVVEFIKPKK